MEYGKIRGEYEKKVVTEGRVEYKLDIDHLRIKTQDQHIFDASVDCNYSMALSDNEEYIHNQLQSKKGPKYHLRRR